MMKHYTQLKEKLYNACLLFVKQKEESVLQTIASYKNDLFSETKSSAGDKHETGRAMIQLEMEKAGQQLASIDIMKEILSKISINRTSKIGCLGSLIITNKANYFLAISAGKINIENIDYFAVSINSPIGSQLLGKEVGISIPLNNTIIKGIY